LIYAAPTEIPHPTANKKKGGRGKKIITGFLLADILS
jgi:hypothetical protein